MEDILRKLVAFPTVTGDGQAAHEALDYIVGFVVQRGMHVERFDSNGFESLVATTKPGNKTPKVMLAAHLDVVPAPDELFDLRLANGKFYGRGVLDMKWALAAYMQVIDELSEHGSLESYDFGLMITTDEEVGGADGVKMLVDEGYIPEVCILPDGGDNWQIQLTSKGFLYVKISTEGKTAHGSRPWLGQNAFTPLTEVIKEVQALFPGMGPQTNTYNLGMVQGGNAVNQVADHAEAFIDIRATSAKEKTWIISMVEKICQRHDASLEIVLNGDATSFSLDDPLIAPFAKLITAVTGTKVEGSHTLGANDTRYFAPHGTPCISFYPTGGGHHGPEEWLDETAFYQSKEILWRYIRSTAKD